MSSAATAPRAAGAVVNLGRDVYQIDTSMAGFERITGGYLIRSSRPWLVETGTAPSAPVVRDALPASAWAPMTW